MNKYLILGIVIAVFIGGGFLYRMFNANRVSYQASGIFKNITLVAKKNQWRFTPETIEVDAGDTVVLEIVNEDSYDHGIAIEAFGVSQRIPANATIKTQFVASKVGEFPFYCSVPCGEGHVDGIKRTHFDMIGKLRIKNIVSPAP